ncbi:uncharacterized protein A1O9_09720 [Exophiala aquamarina CBS 119918]|uniref:ATP-dependent RNA helicase n=1 Tax=Exophiala aquamarina CBS 119918 TaxID=1182545 RepID=A0A072PEE4_9EURO|nr:uncharacterized protein A1O9_09720 [Exophiala aquamarina CBS 119918]KEF53925.1 hypothetical protein A1O9_09720 [Exophiala aquamarina CBS 119918]
MGPRGGHNGRPKFNRASQQPRALKRKRQEEDLDALSQRVDDLDPKSSAPPESFSDLPLSRATADGLEASHFKSLTTIQSRTIPLALKGSDILGAAKTGSGKTLAFLVPVLENLYRKRWTEYDGLGALILSPTRELAIQIFDVLRKIGRNHTFSAGLVIGGKSLQEEKERLGRMNILVATPGRMLQHMDQTAELEIGNLQMLVLDEADRILDMGFQQTIDALVEHLPSERQTLLFSATQTKKVSDLARLSLKEPEFVSVHEAADSATPSSLQQNYIVSPLPEKLDTLWSFIRANVKKKILVFFSSGKQVRFVYESFRHLQPGISLLHLHGRQKQTARLDITTKFSNSKYACLFSTDVAARGLDFPAVDWVVQVDAPEDADTYIHRVGRTARFEHEGHAVMFLDPSEEKGMLDALGKKKVTLEKIHVRQKKMQNTVRNQLQNMCFKDPELKYLGQKAFVSYVRSVHIQKDKETFSLKKLDLEQFAASLGLPGAPRVRFVKGEDAKARKNAPRALVAALGSSSEDDSDATIGKKGSRDKQKTVRTKYDRMFDRRNQDVLADHYTKLIDNDNDDWAGKSRLVRDHAADADSDHDFLSVKRRFEAGDSDLDQQEDPTSSAATDSEHELGPGNGDSGQARSRSEKQPKPKTLQLSTNPSAEPLTIDSHRREKLLQSKKKLLKYKGHGTHMTFDSDSDTPQNHRAYRDEATFTNQGKSGVEEEKARFLERERDRARKMDVVDKEVAREKKREKKDRRRERERAMLANEEDDEVGGPLATLAPYDEDEEITTSRAYESDEVGTPPPKAKRQKKWFEDPSSSEGDGDQQSRQKTAKKKHKHRADRAVEQPQTLEDLEALASGLLANDGAR